MTFTKQRSINSCTISHHLFFLFLTFTYQSPFLSSHLPSLLTNLHFSSQLGLTIAAWTAFLCKYKSQVEYDCILQLVLENAILSTCTKPNHSTIVFLQTLQLCPLACHMTFQMSYTCTIVNEQFIVNLTVYVQLAPSILTALAKTCIQVSIRDTLSIFDRAVHTAMLTKEQEAVLVLLALQGHPNTQCFQLRIEQYTNDILFSIMRNIFIRTTSILGQPQNSSLSSL